tara:strand:+ start:10637 stop:12658 length:2022 start_codon:yes stop_codon:yes gene_type:complete
MPLINFKSDLTNLPWGRDKRGGGDSNQPYITKDIPTGLESDDLPVRSGPDFIVRGGLKSVSNALDDVSRLAQMFVDTKNPSAGLGFIAKQNILSRTSVKTPASYGIGYAGSTDYYFEPGIGGLVAAGGGNVNQGVYTPVGTLATALGTGLGLHANLLGLDPFSPMSGVVEGSLLSGDLGLNTYESATKILNETSQDNRLVIFNDRANEVGTNEDINLYSYSGGPGAVLGIGQTNIRFADQRTGFANANGVGIEAKTYQTTRWNNRTTGSFISPLTNGVSTKYGEATNFVESLNFMDGEPIITADGGFSYTQNFVYSVNTFTTSSILNNPSVLYRNNSRTFTQNQIVDKLNVIEGGQTGLYPTDFRKELYDVNGVNLEDTETSTIISNSPSYRIKNKDIRLNQGQPGKQGGKLRDDSQADSLGKNVWNYGIKATELEALDKITAMPMYSSVGPDVNQPINDLVKFRIAAINNDRSDGQAVYMHFRAFIDSMSDSYTSTWNPVNYVGRGDTLHNYGGFGRTISLGFTVAAQSKAELIPMYKKLNYLASTLAPDYTQAGFMRGNLVRLTIGGYLYEQPGFITSLTYDVPQESTWEIGLNEEGGSDSSVKELPHMIKVSGFSFTPIHTFLPEKPNNANNPDSRFIALSSAPNSRGNYNDEYRTYQANATAGGDNITT